jgi:hypothetical protein
MIATSNVTVSHPDRHHQRRIAMKGCTNKIVIAAPESRIEG